MTVKVRKIAGERPIKTVVLRTLIEFDADGYAEVTKEVAEVLAQIPHEYEVLEGINSSEGGDEGDEGGKVDKENDENTGDKENDENTGGKENDENTGDNTGDNTEEDASEGNEPKSNEPSESKTVMPPKRRMLAKK